MRDWLIWLWKVINLTICYLQTGAPGKLIVVSVQTQRPENKRSQWYKVWWVWWCKSESESSRTKNQEHQYLRAIEDKCPSSSRDQIHSSFYFFFFLFKPSVDWLMPIHITHIAEGYPLYLSINSNANLFQKYPNRQTQK